MAEHESRPFSTFLFQGLKALALGSLIFIFLLFLSISIFQLVYWDRIFPGIHIQGYPVGGMTIEEAAVDLTQHFSLTGQEEVQLSYLDKDYPAQATEIGLSLDAVRTAIAAHQFGRSLPIQDWFWQQPFIFTNQIEIAPVVVLDQNKTTEKLQAIAQQEDIPVKEAALFLKGTQVHATSGQIGRALDLDASLAHITVAITNNQRGRISLVVLEKEPALLDASAFIPTAQAILNQPFIISVPDGLLVRNAQWTLTPENLAPMLTFSADNGTPGTLQPQFSQSTLSGLLASIAEQVDAPPENPRFIFNDDTLELDLFIEGIPGKSVDMEASKKAIQTAMGEGRHRAELVINTLAPDVENDATAEKLGVTELVHVESSFFYGSDNARIQNIETAANEFLGLLVAPGETFSMASAMGDISLDNGYSEALIIYNGKTIEGVGGGVCQVSTTLFRTAFFAGFPINERHPHAYRVSYYEKVAGNNRDSNLAGLDATVYIPLVDLKFTNDTPYWLLMEAYVNRSASRITWKFYSTYDGRTMEWVTTGLTNKVEPKKPLYILNEDLEAGEIKQVDWEAEGADVTVSRVVYKDGEVHLQDSYFTQYAPWRAVYEYGPGTEGIPKQETD